MNDDELLLEMLLLDVLLVNEEGTLRPLGDNAGETSIFPS